MKKGDKIFLIILTVWSSLYFVGWLQQWAGVYEDDFEYDISTYIIGTLFWFGIPYLIYRFIRHRKEKKLLV